MGLVHIRNPVASKSIGAGAIDHPRDTRGLRRTGKLKIRTTSHRLVRVDRQQVTSALSASCRSGCSTSRFPAATRVAGTGSAQRDFCQVTEPSSPTARIGTPKLAFLGNEPHVEAPDACAQLAGLSASRCHAAQDAYLDGPLAAAGPRRCSRHRRPHRARGRRHDRRRSGSRWTLEPASAMRLPGTGVRRGSRRTPGRLRFATWGAGVAAPSPAKT